MAEDKKVAFPTIPVKSWWLLRKKFQQSIPSVVTENYIASVLNIELRSARINVLNPLKQIGFIDEDGKPTETVKDWRDDQNYPNVCQTILARCYPSELLDLFNEPDAEFASIQRWFMNHSGVGESAARKQAAFYQLLVAGDPTKASETTKNASGTVKSKPLAAKAVAKAAAHDSSENAPTSTPNVSAANGLAKAPSLHIDIQIHISPDTSAEQIDKIFASMAKHLQGVGQGNPE